MQSISTPTTTKCVVHVNTVFNHSSPPNSSSSLKCTYVNMRLDTIESSSTIIYFTFRNVVCMTFCATSDSDQYFAVFPTCSTGSEQSETSFQKISSTNDCKTKTSVSLDIALSLVQHKGVLRNCWALNRIFQYAHVQE